MGIDIHMWIEGKDIEGNWFVANPRYVDYKNPEKVREVKEFTVRRDYTFFQLWQISKMSALFLIFKKIVVCLKMFQIF